MSRQHGSLDHYDVDYFLVMAFSVDSDSSTAQDVRDLALTLGKERDRLRIELAAANQVIEELSSQNSTYEHLLGEAHSALQFWDTFYAVSIGKPLPTNTTSS